MIISIDAENTSDKIQYNKIIIILERLGVEGTCKEKTHQNCSWFLNRSCKRQRSLDQGTSRSKRPWMPAYSTVPSKLSPIVEGKRKMFHAIHKPKELMSTKLVPENTRNNSLDWREEKGQSKMTRKTSEAVITKAQMRMNAKSKTGASTHL